VSAKEIVVTGLTEVRNEKLPGSDASKLRGQMEIPTGAPYSLEKVKCLGEQNVSNWKEKAQTRVFVGCGGVGGGLGGGGFFGVGGGGVVLVWVWGGGGGGVVLWLVVFGGGGGGIGVGVLGGPGNR